MTTTTLAAAPAQHRACPKHGLLDGDPKRCPHCDKQTYDLRDDNERGTLLAVRRVTERPRRVRWAVAATVGAVVVKGVLLGMMTGTFTFEVNELVAGYGAAGYALAWLLRRPAMHRLDKALGLRVW